MHLLTKGAAFSLNKERNHLLRNKTARTLYALILYGSWAFPSFWHPVGRQIYLSHSTKHHNIYNIQGERGSMFLTADLREKKNHSDLMLSLSKREMVPKT